MIYIKKSMYDNVESIDPNEIFNYISENDDKFSKMYPVFKACSDYLNWYQFNTPPAAGDVNFARIQGFMNRLLTGYGYDIIEENKLLKIVNQTNKVIMQFDIPTLPNTYFTHVKDNIEILKNLI